MQDASTDGCMPDTGGMVNHEHPSDAHIEDAHVCSYRPATCFDFTVHPRAEPAPDVSSAVSRLEEGLAATIMA